MHRCHVGSDLWQKEFITLPPDEKHHLLDVMRANPGDIVEVFDGKGRRTQTELVLKNAEHILRIIPDTIKKHSATGDIILIVALPKGKRMDLIVEKATELGVSEVWPVITDRVVSRPDDDRLAERVERWNRIAKSAAKQCGIDKIPNVPQAMTYQEAINQSSFIDILLIGALDAAPETMHAALQMFNKSSNQKIGLLIGPEGDFTEKEMDMAKNAGAIPVSFGELTLRVETAALYGLSVLRYALTATAG